MKLVLNILAIFIIVAPVLSGCGGGGGELSREEKEALAAKVDDWTYTRDQLRVLLNSLSDSDRARYDTPYGRVELTDKMIMEELYHQEALKEGYLEEEAIQAQLDNYKRAVLIKEYYERVVKPRAYPTEEELHDYYEQNQQTYSTLPIVRAYHIQHEDPELLRELKARHEAGESFNQLAMNYSQDEGTKRDGGDLGYFNPGGYIRSIGFSKEISEAAMSTEVMGVSDPVKFSKGYSIVKVVELRPAELKPFEEVKDEIRELFVKKRIEKVERECYVELREKYPVHNLIEEETKLTQRTAEELWNLAQTSTDPYQRLRTYEEIVTRYPDGKYAAQALFMVGFVHAEELKDAVMADRAFTRVLNEYPDSDVAGPAKWMLENLNNPLPAFEDLDELREKISEESG